MGADKNFSPINSAFVPISLPGFSQSSCQDHVAIEVLLTLGTRYLQREQIVKTLAKADLKNHSKQRNGGRSAEATADGPPPVGGRSAPGGPDSPGPADGPPLKPGRSALRARTGKIAKPSSKPTSGAPDLPIRSTD